MASFGGLKGIRYVINCSTEFFPGHQQLRILTYAAKCKRCGLTDARQLEANEDIQCILEMN